MRSFAVDAPEQYRYKWRPQPIIPNDELLKLYDSCVIPDSPTVPLHNLLGISEDLTALEKVRVSLVEVIIGAIRKSSDIVDLIYEMESGQPNEWRENFCASIVALTGQSVFPTKVLRFSLLTHSRDFKRCVFCSHLKNLQTRISNPSLMLGSHLRKRIKHKFMLIIRATRIKCILTIVNIFLQDPLASA